MFDVILLPLLAAMFLAINMGGSGTSAAFSSAYGANLIRKDLIPGLFGLFVMLGAIMAGKEVTLTIGRGVLPEAAMTFSVVTVVLLAIALSMFFANMLKVPQSTSQSTLAALVAAALWQGNLQTEKLFFEIIPSWFFLPMLSFLFMLLLGKYIYRPIKEQSGINFNQIGDHPVLRLLVIAASCYVAFSIGANNVANAAGPVTGLLVNKFGVSIHNSRFFACMIVSTLIVAPCFALGSSLFGSRVLKTTGKDIIDFGPIGAFAISFVTGTLLLFASIYKGIPTPLAQLNVGAIIGLGVYKVGFREIAKSTAVRKVFVVWLVAPLISFLLVLVMMHFCKL